MRFHGLSHHAATLCIVAALAAQPAAAKVISVSAATPDANEKLQEALILAEPGDIVQLGAGTWTLTDGLSLDVANVTVRGAGAGERSEEHTSALQSLMRTSYAVFCL